MTVSQLKAELEKGPQEAAVYTQQIHQLQSTLNNVQQQSQVRLLRVSDGRGTISSCGSAHLSPHAFLPLKESLPYLLWYHVPLVV